MNIACDNCPVSDVLAQIESQAAFHFSYNPNQIQAEQKVSYNLDNEQVRAVLKTVFAGQCSFREYSNFILLYRSAEKELTQQTIATKITHGRDNQPIAGATIYQIKTKNSVLSDRSGQFQIELEKTNGPMALGIHKSGYVDTVITIAAGSEVYPIKLLPTPVYLSKIKTKTPGKIQRTREVEKLPVTRAFVPDYQIERAMNLDEILNKIPFQFSLLPNIGTNKLTSGFSENNLSVNILAGYNAGLKGLEVAGLFNILREDAKGIQVAGLGNTVGGKVQGIQVAGLYNNVRGTVVGGQAAGVYNLVLDTIQGVQVAGIVNILHGSITGAQFSGLINVATENMSGLQAAGFGNITRKHVYMGQAAGFYNIAGEVEGAQVAGFFNRCDGGLEGVQAAGFANSAKDTVTGVQVAGFMNTTQGDMEGIQAAGIINVANGDLKGTQVASLFNFARNVEGTQLGLINIADSSDRSFGLLSFATSGYWYFTGFADEIAFANISFTTGNPLLYNVFTFGYGNWFGLEINKFGYALGHEFKLGKKHSLQLTTGLKWLQNTAVEIPPPTEIDSNTTVRTTYENPLNLIVHINTEFHFRLKKRLHLVVGPTWNLGISGGSIALKGQPVPPYPAILSRDPDRYETTFWPGFKIGLRL